MRKTGCFLMRFCVIAAMCVLVVFFCNGCSETNNDEVALAVVVGPRSNEPDIPLNAVSIKNAIYNSCYTYGSVAFITCDGSPKVVYQTNIPKPDKSGLSENKKRSIADRYTGQLLHELSIIQPTVPEADTLKAVNYASKTLSGSSESADKVLVVMDNGLSTTGYLDFTKDLLYADTQDIVNALKDARAIPDLQGISVVWMYLGQTAAPQEELSEAQKYKLEDVWRAILTEGGADRIEFTDDIASDMPDADYPEVSVVDVQDRSIQVDTEEPITTIILDNSSVRFVGDKAEFVNYGEASGVLKQYAELLLQHPDNVVYVIGTTATGAADFCNELSENRANAVKEVLVFHGVPEKQLITIGLGYKDPWHIEDLDENGNQIEKYACQNRKVLIVDVNSVEAAKLNREDLDRVMP